MWRLMGLCLLVGCQLQNKGAPDTAVVVPSDDADGDGYPASVDCDDGAFDVNPAATEVCDGVDNNCDGEIDEAGAVGEQTWYRDADGDGYGDAGVSMVACDPPDGAVSDDTDCDDTAVYTYPGSAEVCDGLDNDCDGEIDESGAYGERTWYVDGDGDGYGDPATPEMACDEPDGAVATDDDCDDADATIHPGAEERCDGVDNNCDGAVDEATATDASTWYADADGDGYGDASMSEVACDAPSGAVDNSADCDDADAAISPAAAEMCDGVDNDCDGDIDEADAVDATTWYEDADGDGFGYGDSKEIACKQPDGFVGLRGDCDDTDDAVNPDATEICDGIDNDCDGKVDGADAEGALTWYADADGDGYGDPSVSELACDQPDGAVANDSDCDDTDATVYLGATEVAGDGKDNNCDGINWRWDGETTADSTSVIALAGGTYRAYAGKGFAILDDLDADGDAELAIGAPYYTNGTTSAAGAAFVFLGPITDGGTMSTADAAAYGTRSNADLGQSMTSLGDADGDGTTDLAIGSYGNDSVLIYYDYAPTAASSGPGDLGPADLTVGGTATGYDFGYAVANAGDFSGAGGADVIIGAKEYSSEKKGAVYVMFGDAYASATSDLGLFIVGAHANDSIGSAVAGPGDVTGDGTPDILIGVPKLDRGASADVGAAYMIEGPEKGSVTLGSVGTRIQLRTDAEACAGTSVAGAGDVDGDGVNDVLIGSPGCGTTGDPEAEAWLVLGGDTFSSAEATFTGSTTDELGYSVSSVGDLDADGNPDLLIGAPQDGDLVGSAGLWYGPVTGTYDFEASGADATFSAAGPGDRFGEQVGGGADLTGDGVPDLVIAAPYLNGGTSPTYEEGTVYIFPGTAP